MVVDDGDMRLLSSATLWELRSPSQFLLAPFGLREFILLGPCLQMEYQVLCVNLFTLAQAAIFSLVLRHSLPHRAPMLAKGPAKGALVSHATPSNPTKTFHTLHPPQQLPRLSLADWCLQL